jgi:ABC-type multidrug transport system ATPase subunit
LLEEVGLAERADERIGGYSGGMRQRVAVARTLLRLPPVIVVDEPTVGLDPRERIRFRNLLARLSEGRVVLFSTHVVEDVEVACERVIVMARGRVVFDGVPLDLASAADGRVWQLQTAANEPPFKPGPDAVVVDQVPEPDGGARLRVLSGSKPQASATPAAPTLQDGYLWLVGRRAGA